LEGDPLLRRGALEGDSPVKKSVSEADPLFKKSAPIELIVNPTIRSATAAGIDLTFTPLQNAFTGVHVEFVSKLLILAGRPSKTVSIVRAHAPSRGTALVT
jgi:hypothetical protein